MTQQWISFKLKEVKATSECVRWWFINLDRVTSISIVSHRIDLFFTGEDDQINILKDEHPTAFHSIRDFLLRHLKENYCIIEEEADPHG